MFFDWNYFKIQQLKRQVKEGKLPTWVDDYLQYYQTRQLNQDLKKARFVVFDTETTGLDLKKDHIISIGAVALSAMKIEINDSIELFLQSDSTGSKDSVKVHQILKNQVKDGLKVENALAGFFNYIKGDVVVAHFAEFDVKMISKVLKNQYHIPFLNPAIDTIQLAKRLDGISSWDETIKGGDYTLDALCQKYKINIGIRHNAVGDALATAELLQILLHKAYQRGIKKIKDLLN
jgi:DNA polymerase-3 subunit epsilon